MLIHVLDTMHYLQKPNDYSPEITQIIPNTLTWGQSSPTLWESGGGGGGGGNSTFLIVMTLLMKTIYTYLICWSLTWLKLLSLSHVWAHNAALADHKLVHVFTKIREYSENKSDFDFRQSTTPAYILHMNQNLPSCTIRRRCSECLICYLLKAGSNEYRRHHKRNRRLICHCDYMRDVGPLSDL